MQVTSLILDYLVLLFPQFSFLLYHVLMLSSKYHHPLSLQRPDLHLLDYFVILRELLFEPLALHHPKFIKTQHPHYALQNQEHLAATIHLDEHLDLDSSIKAHLTHPESSTAHYHPPNFLIQCPPYLPNALQY